MPSPFPGMNPYLEQDGVWHDFHQSYIPALRDALMPLLQPFFIAKVEMHLYVSDPANEVRILAGVADVGIRREQPYAAVAASGTAALAAPASIILPRVEKEKEGYLEIVDRNTHELITVIEMLSPTNKRQGPNRQQYLAKRDTLLETTAHFVELDFLRGGPRTVEVPPPGCDYGVIVSRGDERPRAGLWPLKLRDPLPVIPIPLRPPLAEVHLDLQAVLHTVYDRALYGLHIYKGSPEPPLKPEDAAWAAALVGQN